MKEIKRLVVSVDGKEPETIEATKEEPIERFGVNGEMAEVNWYRKGKLEINGKFVIYIFYN